MAPRGYVDAPDAPGARTGGLPIKTIVLSFLVFFAVLTLYSGYYRTNAGHEDIVIRFGAAVRTSEPGPHWKLPYVEAVHPVEIRERKFVITLQAASKDPMEMPVEVAFNWLVNKNNVIEMYNEFGELSQFEERIVHPRVQDRVKGVISQYPVNELLTKRVEWASRASEAVVNSIPQNIMTIKSFSVVNVGFPKEYTAQNERVQVARARAEEEAQKTEQQKWQVQTKVNTAEADAKSLKFSADADAYAAKTRGAGEAEAIRLRGSAENDNLDRRGKILSAGGALVEYRRAETWNGKLPDHFWGGDAAAATMFNMPGRTLSTAGK